MSKCWSNLFVQLYISLDKFINLKIRSLYFKTVKDFQISKNRFFEVFYNCKHNFLTISHIARLYYLHPMIKTKIFKNNLNIRGPNLLRFSTGNELFTLDKLIYLKNKSVNFKYYFL